MLSVSQKPYDRSVESHGWNFCQCCNTNTANDISSTNALTSSRMEQQQVESLWTTNNYRHVNCLLQAKVLSRLSMSPSRACAVSSLLRRLGIRWEPTTRQTVERFHYMIVTRHYSTLPLIASGIRNHLKLTERNRTTILSFLFCESCEDTRTWMSVSP